MGLNPAATSRLHNIQVTYLTTLASACASVCEQAIFQGSPVECGVSPEAIKLLVEPISKLVEREAVIGAEVTENLGLNQTLVCRILKLEESASGFIDIRAPAKPDIAHGCVTSLA